MRKLIWVLVVLAVLAVGVDRLADLVAERVAGSSLQSSQRLENRPDVDITGFPFLTQLARRHYDEVDVSDPSVRVGQRIGTPARRLALRDVRVRLLDVTTSSDLQRFAASRARASATVPYAELRRLTGLRLTYAGGGRVRAGKRVDVAGQQLTPTITITPRLLDGAVSLGGDLTQGLSSLPAPVASALRGALGVDVPLTGLPFDVRPTSLRATPDGLRLRLVGRDLTYP